MNCRDHLQKNSKGLFIAFLAFAVIGLADAAELDEARQSILLRDFDSAYSQLRELADAGDLDAKYLLAGLLRRGLGTERDASRADALYAELQVRGHAATREARAALDQELWPALTSAENPVAALHWAASSFAAANSLSRFWFFICVAK